MTDTGQKGPTLGQKLGKVAGGTVRAAGEGYRFMKLLVILALVGLVVFGIWLLRDIGSSVKKAINSPIEMILGSEPQKPAAERDPDLQKACFTAIVAKDVEGEAAQNLGVARREVGHTINRLRLKYPGLTTCDILAKALTFVPNNFDYPFYWLDRKVWAIKRGQTKAAWTSAELIAEELYGKAPASTGCGALKYIRAEINLRTGGPAWEKKAADELNSTMKPDVALANAGLRMKFLCP